MNLILQPSQGFVVGVLYSYVYTSESIKIYLVENNDAYTFLVLLKVQTSKRSWTFSIGWRCCFLQYLHIKWFMFSLCFHLKFLFFMIDTVWLSNRSIWQSRKDQNVMLLMGEYIVGWWNQVYVMSLQFSYL